MKAHYKRKAAAFVAVLALAVSGGAAVADTVDNGGNGLKRTVSVKTFGNSL